MSYFRTDLKAAMPNTSRYRLRVKSSVHPSVQTYGEEAWLEACCDADANDGHIFLVAATPKGSGPPRPSLHQGMMVKSPDVSKMTLGLVY